ncbi:MAG: hypothetical protein M1833_001382 [Piccolia ochrophora]|nr:MAG: hypothetical protein M1833_001382 [Piccolia ochrophora]
MATDAPDPKSFATWDDAFQYPVPAVRRMEQQLRSDLNGNQERLRSLVGSSYRDLLATAERIMEMDRDVHQVESKLSAVSQSCNARAIETLVRNYSGFNEQQKAKDNERFAFASLLSLLQECPLLVTRLLRKGTAPLLAAKVLVISRHVHKHLSQSTECPPLVEHLRDRLASLRARLLRQIDEKYSRSDTPATNLLEVMCAYSLATSSTPTDILRHFHHVRLDAIATCLNDRSSGRSRPLEALDIYFRTVQETRSHFPRQTAESLLKLKLQPLLADKDVRAAAEMSLDVHEHWIPEDIRQFTPWVRHDDLHKSQTEELLKSWATKAFKSLLSRLQDHLESIEDFTTLVQLRKDLLQIWFDGRQALPRLASYESLESLRSVLKGQIVRLVRRKVMQLQAVCGQIIETLQDEKIEPSHAQNGLWDDAIISMDMTKGDMRFRDMVSDRVQGRSDAVLQCVRSYRSWLHQMEEVLKGIKELKAQQWDDDLDDDDDDDDGALESRSTQLGDEDAKFLEDALAETLTQAFQNLQVALQDTVTDQESDHSKHHSIFLLRIVREIRRSPTIGGDLENFGLETISILHQLVAETTCQESLAFLSRYQHRRRKRESLVTRALWEGTPQLPLHPSPTIYKFLHRLVASMAEAGGDLWSPLAVSTLKKYLRAAIAMALEEPVSSAQISNGDIDGVETEGNELPTNVDGEEDEPAMTNGTEEQKTQIDPTRDKDLDIQRLFDVLFLQQALRVLNAQRDDTTARDALDGFEAILWDRVGDIKASEDRLRKSAQDYWKRVQLLFALVA